MSRIVITKACTLNNQAMEHLKVGDVLEATAAQLTAITAAGGTTRASNTAGLRDALGEAFAASNASA